MRLRSIDGAATYAGLAATDSIMCTALMLGLPPPITMIFCDCAGGSSAVAPWSRAPKLKLAGIAAPGSGAYAPVVGLRNPGINPEPPNRMPEWNTRPSLSRCRCGYNGHAMPGPATLQPVGLS